MAEDTGITGQDADPGDGAGDDGHGQKTASWRDNLPEDMRGAKSLEGFEDVSALAKSYLETKAMVGANTIKLPERTAEPAVWDEYFKAAGRPDESGGYKLPADGLPDGFKLSDTDVGSFKELAYNSGLNERQTAELYRGYAKMQTDATAKIQANDKAINDANIEAVKTEYGTALEDRQALAKRLISQYDTEDGQLAALLNQTGMGNHPAMFGFISRIAQQLAEDTILGAGQVGVAGTAPAEAQAEIQQLETDTDFMKSYHNRDNPGHAGAQARMKKLYNAAYPEPAAV